MTHKTNIIQSFRNGTKSSAYVLSQTDDGVINQTLFSISSSILANTDDIMKHNLMDLDGAISKNLSPALLDRLTLNSARIHAMAQSVLDISCLENPCGKTLEEWVRPNGLNIKKISVPIGVLGMIYESRPNVTVDAAALCLKSRNAVILRAGSDSFNTSKFLHGLVVDALKRNNLPIDCVCMVPDTDRAIVDDMLAASNVIDVMIPRGGKSLTSKVMSEAKMPVFAHLDGNCHIYVHPSANPNIVLDVVKNAKLRRTGVCGALESLLLDDDMDVAVVEKIIQMLLREGVTIVGDDKAQSFDARIGIATDDDWFAEYLDKKISIKFVSGVEKAVAHINHYGSHHTDSILSEETTATQYFLKNVDSAIVMHNTSTQFADGGEFGFGAEIGIGTGKLHARGPVGVKQLCTFKYVVQGDGQTRL